MRQIIWTRSEVERQRDAQWMPDPARVIWVPCIATRSLAYAMPPVSAPYAFAFTSTQAVEETIRHPALLACLQQAIWVGTFGEKTYARLSQIPGFSPQRIAVTSAEDFARILGTVSPAQRDPVTWILPGPVTRAFPLADFLRSQGYRVVQADLYETRAQVPTRYNPHTLLSANRNYALCFASPSAVRGFCAWLPLLFSERQFHVYVLGKSTLAACRGRFSQVEMVSPQRVETLAKMAFS